MLEEERSKLEKMEQELKYRIIGQDEDYSNMKDKVLEALKENFRPEFLNRLDEIIVFDVLSPEAILEIVKLRVGLS